MFKNVEEAFKDLDEKEFHFLAATLSAYRDSLLKHGFTRKEAMKLVEAYSKYIYDMSIEDYMKDDEEEDSDYADGEDLV